MSEPVRARLKPYQNEPFLRPFRLYWWNGKEPWVAETAKDHILSELLLIRYQQGDTSALDELVKQWQDRLFYYIRRLVTDEDDAWDALQDTWVALVRNIGELRNQRSVVMWLYKIARHKAMDRLRKRYRDHTVSIDDDVVPEVEEQTDTFTFEDAEQVHCALGKISEHHREVLTLFFLADLSIDEIAEVLDIAIGTVKSRLHFARKALRSAIEEEEARQ
jgi:RNA polymerase sigma factor (sigma-70 family)